MSNARYVSNKGVYVTFNSITILLPVHMNCSALARYVKELEALYGAA